MLSNIPLYITAIISNNDIPIRLDMIPFILTAIFILIITLILYRHYKNKNILITGMALMILHFIAHPLQIHPIIPVLIVGTAYIIIMIYIGIKRIIQKIRKSPPERFI